MRSRNRRPSSLYALQVEADSGCGIQDEVGQGIHLVQVHLVARVNELVQMKIEG